MENVLKMVGSYTSHAIWSVSDGETLIPIVGYLKSDGSHSMERMVMGSVQALSIGEDKISKFDADTLGATFIKDGFVTLESGKTDALIVNIRFSDSSEKKIQLILPYRNANHHDGFAVHRLQVTEFEGIERDNADSLLNAFFDGLESHEQGSKIYNEQYVEQAGISSDYQDGDNTDLPQEDYELLKQSPFLIFFLVAAADGKVDKKELKAFGKLLTDPQKITNPLLIRIITNVINDIPQIISEMANKDINFLEELDNLKNIIDRNLTEDEANSFKVSLFLVGKEIAEASGGFLGFGSKIGKEEKAALAAIALCLGINLD